MDIGCLKDGLRQYFAQLCETIKKVDTSQLAEMTEVLYRAYLDNKQIFTMGNGGHANTAAHMINDIAKHTTSSDDKDARVLEKGFRTMCLNDSVSFLTGLANDMGFECVFSEQLKNWCDKGDVVIGVSGSGNSKNILNAFEIAKKCGATTICLSGKGGGKSKEAVDICIVVPSDKMVQIEDIHLAINHAVADEIKKIIQNRVELTG